MTSEEFNLSDKVRIAGFEESSKIIEFEDVKEFIRKLKEEVDKCSFDLMLKGGKENFKEEVIDKLAGEKLVK